MKAILCIFGLATAVLGLGLGLVLRAATGQRHPLRQESDASWRGIVAHYASGRVG